MKQALKETGEAYADNLDASKSLKKISSIQVEDNPRNLNYGVFIVGDLEAAFQLAIISFENESSSIG